MAVSYIWPPSLPQQPNLDYSEKSGVLILRTKTDAGPAKMRRRGAMPDVLTVSFYMKTSQVETLEAFIYETIKGVARFGFSHPRKQQQVEVRIVPNGDGELYGVSYYGPELWLVSMTLEVLP